MHASEVSEELEKRAREYRSAGNEEYCKALRTASAIIFFEGDKPQREALRKAVYDMDERMPECFPQSVLDDNEGIRDMGDIPFMTEAFLYPLSGKIDTRTLLAIWSSTRKVISALESTLEDKNS